MFDVQREVPKGYVACRGGGQVHKKANLVPVLRSDVGNTAVRRGIDQADGRGRRE